MKVNGRTYDAQYDYEVRPALHLDPDRARHDRDTALFALGGWIIVFAVVLIVVHFQLPSVR